MSIDHKDVDMFIKLDRQANFNEGKSVIYTNFLADVPDDNSSGLITRALSKSLSDKKEVGATKLAATPLPGMAVIPPGINYMIYIGSCISLSIILINGIREFHNKVPTEKVSPLCMKILCCGINNLFTEI